MTLRVAFVVDDLRAGGATRQLAVLAPALRPRIEPSVHVLSGLAGPPAGMLADAGVAVHVHARARTPRLWRLAHALARERAQLVHGWLDASNAWGALAATMRGIPFVLAIQSDRLRLAGVRAAVLRAALRRAGAVTVNSEAGARFLERDVGVAPSRIVRVPNWVDPAAVERARRRAAADARNHRDGVVVRDPAASPPPGAPTRGMRRVGFVGRLVALKRVDRLVEAVARLVAEGRDVRLDVVGDGPERERLEALARRLGVASRCEFTGMLADPLPRMASLDALVLPSEFEGLPNAVIEALALGVPVVASAVGDLPRVIDDGRTGRLVHDGDDLARAIASVLDDPSLRQNARHDGPAVVARAFSIDAAVETLTGLYERLVRSDRSDRISRATRRAGA